MLKITLKNKKGEKVVYEQDFISARSARKAFELIDSFNGGEVVKESERLDKMVEFVAGIFEDKGVTTESIWDGLQAQKTVEELNRVIDEVIGRGKKPLEEE